MHQAVCVRSKTEKRKQKYPSPLKKHHEIHGSPAIAITSRRRATKHAPHVSPYSPASIDPGFVGIGPRTALEIIENHILTDRQTDRQTDIQTDRHTNRQTDRQAY